jgi:hypothetical protein
MKILWIPQLATIDKVSGKIIINADSNMTIFNGMLEGFTKNKFTVDILMPSEKLCNAKFKDVIDTKIINKIHQLKNGPLSSFSLRYDFDFREYCEIIEKANPDIIVNNTPSITKNLKAVLFHLKSKCKVVNFLHFLDYPGEDKVPLPISYFMRQIEGIIWSDLAVFQSYTVRDKALLAINKYFKKYTDEYNKSIKRKSINHVVWNATYSQNEIDKEHYIKEKFEEKKTIIFPNRLSSTNYSNHLRFFEAIRNISKKRNDFQVIVNNPTQYMSYDEIAKLCPNLLVLNNGNLLDKNQYFTILHQCDIGVALFVQEGHGGVSSKQFQAAGCLPVFPKCNEYQYLMPKTYKGFCKSNLKGLEKSLEYALNVCRTKEGNKLVEIAKDKIYKRDSFESNMKNVIDSLKHL